MLANWTGFRWCHIERKIFFFFCCRLFSTDSPTRNYSANVISDITVGLFNCNVKIESSIPNEYKQTATEIIPTIENKSNLFNVYRNNGKKWHTFFVCWFWCVCVCVCVHIILFGFWMNTRDVLNAWQKKNSRWWWWRPTATTKCSMAKIKNGTKQDREQHRPKKKKSDVLRKQMSRNRAHKKIRISLKLFICTWEREEDWAPKKKRQTYKSRTNTAQNVKTNEWRRTSNSLKFH